MPGGKELEHLIRSCSRKLAERQVARIFRWPEEKIEQRRSSQCTSCGTFSSHTEVLRTAKNGCDFFGYTASGRHIAIEAKQGIPASLPIWAKSGHGIQVHQMLHLTEVARAGGLALVVWKRGGLVATVDIDMIAALSEERKSLAWAKIPAKFIHMAEAEEAILTPHITCPV